MNLANPIAQGRTADVYPWGEAHILKLYREWCPAEWVEHEAHVAQILTQAGVPTPAVGEIIRVEGRLGIIYERISGSSMLDSLRRFPLGIFQHGRALAELQAQIHRQTIPSLNTYQNGLARAIQSAPSLPENLRQKALAQLATLPTREALCHGDFHPGNVLISPRGPVVIDWMTASQGSPWADVARTSLILTIDIKGAGKMVPPSVRLLTGLLHHIYLARYQALVPGGQAELKCWQPIIAAARLAEQITPEREALLSVITAGLDT